MIDYCVREKGLWSEAKLLMKLSQFQGRLKSFRAEDAEQGMVILTSVFSQVHSWYKFEDPLLQVGGGALFLGKLLKIKYRPYCYRWASVGTHGLFPLLFILDFSHFWSQWLSWWHNPDLHV